MFVFCVCLSFFSNKEHFTGTIFLNKSEACGIYRLMKCVKFKELTIKEYMSRVALLNCSSLVKIKIARGSLKVCSHYNFVHFVAANDQTDDQSL